MNRWLGDLFARLESQAPGVVVLLDPDRVVDATMIGGDVLVAEDWWSLRRQYEIAARRRPVGMRLTLLIRGGVADTALPWDIERAASTIVTARLPGPMEDRGGLAQLAGEEFDRAITSVKGASDPVAALLTTLAGVSIDPGKWSRLTQLRLASRVALRPEWPVAVSKLAEAWVSEPALRGLLRRPPDVSALQNEWSRYAAGTGTDWESAFEGARLEIGQLFQTGLLEPIVARASLPSWAAPGLRDATKEERAEELLATLPQPFPPTALGEWVTISRWWGLVRSLVANAPRPLRERAWTIWADIDSHFSEWLRRSYGLLLSSSAPWPTTVHRIAPFLSRRLREGDADRVMLVVLDGLGHAQWSHLVDRLHFLPRDAGTVCALVPTYTTISRQAIFAGDLPASYPDSLWSTHREQQHWRRFWSADGIPVTEVAYHHVKGRLPVDRINLGRARAIGVVVNALDDLMHSSELFGDAQLLANVDVWADNGFLVDLLTRAAEGGIETWITADHGNLECLPAGAVTDGIVVESAGKRLLRYPNQVLRDASAAEGIVWDNIPGLPDGAEPLLFARGRMAYTNQMLSVSHGSLSMDEFFVPFVRTTP